MRAAGAWATPLSKGWRLLEPQPPRLEVHTDGTCGVTINVLLSDPAAFIAGGTYVEGASAVGGGGGGGGGDGRWRALQLPKVWWSGRAAGTVQCPSP